MYEYIFITNEMISMTTTRTTARALYLGRLCRAVLGEWLATDTTSKLAVEDKVIILQVLILSRA